jgi:hypothetical protein
MVHTWRVAHYAEDSIGISFGDIENILLRGQSEAAWVSQFIIDDRLEHAHTEVNGKDTTWWVFEGSLSERATIGEEEGVVLLRQYHGVGSLQGITIEILNHRSDFNAITFSGNGLTKNGLMSLVCDEWGSLGIEDESGRLAASCESNIHLAFLHLINITIGWDSEEVAILILSRTVERHCDLEELFEICRLSGNHFKCAFLIYF